WWIPSSTSCGVTSAVAPVADLPRERRDRGRRKTDHAALHEGAGAVGLHGGGFHARRGRGGATARLAGRSPRGGLQDARPQRRRGGPTGSPRAARPARG